MTTFPLPLAPFEDYLLADDRADHPMHFFQRMTFCGLVDRTVFEQALATALDRHPLLKAALRPVGRNRYEWFDPGASLPLRWSSGTEPIDCNAVELIDLTRHGGVRVYVDQQEDRSSVLTQYHHVCVDGLGALEFARDLWLGYHELASGRDPADKLRPLDPEQLKVRGKFVGGLVKSLKRIPKEVLALPGVWDYFVHRPTALPAVPSGASLDKSEDSYPSDNDDSRKRLFGTCSHVFSEAETAALRAACKAQGCTLNDLLLRDLYYVLADWTADHDPARADKLVRIMIPTSLRGMSDRDMPAANRLTMAFLDRRPHRFASPRALLDNLRWEMDLIKRHQLGITLLHGICVVRVLPGGLKRMLLEDRCLSTCLLTNVGNLTRFFPLPRREGRLVAGDVAIEQIEGFPPFRPQTHASFVTFIYAKRLNLGLSYNADHFRAADGQDLMNRYTERLRQSVVDACGTDQPPGDVSSSQEKRRVRSK